MNHSIFLVFKDLGDKQAVGNGEGGSERDCHGVEELVVLISYFVVFCYFTGSVAMKVSDYHLNSLNE